MKYLRNTYIEMLVGIECMDPELQREICVVNGVLKVVSVDRALKPLVQMGPPRKVRGLRRAGTKVGSLGKQGLLSQVPFHSILSLLSWPKSSLFHTAYPTGQLSSKPFSHSLPPWQPPDMLVWTPFLPDLRLLV